MSLASVPHTPELPAFFGGSPAFPEGLPFVRPTLPDPAPIADDVVKILSTGVLTNGPYVRELEERTAQFLGVRHCVAVASCTAGLMLVLRAMDLSGDVVLPSFTFSATAHAVSWNGLRPIFADVDPSTLTLSPDSVLRHVGIRTSAIIGTHTYGTPCDVGRLATVASDHGIPLVFDAAHAFGSRKDGVPIGRFGDAEVFSLSPTKVIVAGEGGLIATQSDLLAERCRIGRDYGNPGDYDCRFVGLNARMSEFHAALALASLEGVDDRIARRNELATRYREGLTSVRGISVPTVPEGDQSTFKDFTILVDENEFGFDARGLGDALRADGIQTRHYYAPPVHRQRAYASGGSVNGHLAVTDRIARQVITLPLWGAMSEEQVDRVIDTVDRIGQAIQNS